MTDSGPVAVFDGHNDTLLRLHLSHRPPASLLEEDTAGHIDLPRARRGGLIGGFFAIWVPPEGESPPAFGRRYQRTPDGYEAPLPPALDPDYARSYAVSLTKAVHTLTRQSDGAVQLITHADHLEGLNADTMRILLHLEGAEPVRADISDLAWWYDQGVRSIGLVWSRPNAFGHGVPFKFPSTPDTGPGLSPAGERLVDACGELGILVDLAHLNERGFWNVAERSPRPLVVTHACAHSLAPTARNLTDAQIDAVGATEGVVGINFHVGDLRRDGQRDANTPLDTIVRHIDYVATRIGIDHVAFGSDFDGATIPADLGDAAGLPRLVEALRTAGYDAEAVRKIAHGNWLRVLRDTWRDE